MSRALVVGLGVSGTAAARFLLGEGLNVDAVDDQDGPPVASAEDLGIDLLVRPDRPRLEELSRRADMVVVSPGVPWAHPVFHLGLGERLVG